MKRDGCRLSYKGLGEPLCFLAFGPLATSAFYVAQVGCMASAYYMTPDMLTGNIQLRAPSDIQMLSLHGLSTVRGLARAV